MSSKAVPAPATRSHSRPADGFAGKTAYRIVGTGEPIVFIHGCGLRKEAWQPQVEAFRSDHRVIVYDLLGHGNSARGAPKATFEEFAAQLGDVLDALSLESAIIVGHSLGASIALSFALAHLERVGRLVVMNGVYNRPAGQRAAVIKRAEEIELVGPRNNGTSETLNRWFGATPDPALAPIIRRVRDWVESAGPGYASAYRLFATEADRVHAGRLGGLSMPVLYLTGELDPNSTPEMSRQMAAETPCGQAIAISGERHLMPLAVPETVNALLRDFLNERQVEGQQIRKIGALR
ncbi:MAG: alpha/beta fold hydrolase [Rhodospirillales bacterium]|nr:alpha/beta fold hydrolase [Rhodospirillales bacterium]